MTALTKLCKRCGRPADLTMCGVVLDVCSICVAIQDMEENPEKYKRMEKEIEMFEKIAGNSKP